MSNNSIFSYLIDSIKTKIYSFFSNIRYSPYNENYFEQINASLEPKGEIKARNRPLNYFYILDNLLESYEIKNKSIEFYKNKGVSKNIDNTFINNNIDNLYSGKLSNNFLGKKTNRILFKNSFISKIEKNSGYNNFNFNENEYNAINNNYNNINEIDYNIINNNYNNIKENDNEIISNKYSNFNNKIISNSYNNFNENDNIIIKNAYIPEKGQNTIILNKTKNIIKKSKNIGGEMGDDKQIKNIKKEDSEGNDLQKKEIIIINDEESEKKDNKSNKNNFINLNEKEINLNDSLTIKKNNSINSIRNSKLFNSKLSQNLNDSFSIILNGLKKIDYKKNLIYQKQNEFSYIIRKNDKKIQIEKNKDIKTNYNLFFNTKESKESKAISNKEIKSNKENNLKSIKENENDFIKGKNCDSISHLYKKVLSSNDKDQEAKKEDNCEDTKENNNGLFSNKTNLFSIKNNVKDNDRKNDKKLKSLFESNDIKNIFNSELKNKEDSKKNLFNNENNYLFNNNEIKSLEKGGLFGNENNEQVLFGVNIKKNNLKEDEKKEIKNDNSEKNSNIFGNIGLFGKKNNTEAKMSLFGDIENISNNYLFGFKPL